MDKQLPEDGDEKVEVTEGQEATRDDEIKPDSSFADKIKEMLKDKRIVAALVAAVIVLIIGVVAITGGDPAEVTDPAPATQENSLEAFENEIKSTEDLDELIQQLEELQTRDGSELEQLDSFAE